MHQEGAGDGPVLRIGPHRYRIQGDLFFWQPCEEVTPEHARSVLEVILGIHKQCGYVLYLLDGREGKPLKPATRRIIVDTLRPLQGSLALAAFGLNWPSRTAGILLFSAARLLTGITFPVRFSATEAEARAFLNDYRNGRAQVRNEISQNSAR